MNRLSCTLLWMALLATGCRQPADVELVDDDRSSNLEAYPVALPDTDFVASAIDSTGVLPDDQVRFTGSFVINAVTWDAGGVTKSIAYSRVFVADSAIRVLGRLIGFQGSDVGTVTLNGALMFKIAHRVSAAKIFNRDSVLIHGVEYLADLTDSYLPDHQYTWLVTNRLVPVFTVSTETPERLSVISPKGGTIHLRTQDLPVRWSGGKGKMAIIVSVHDPVLKKTRPLVELRVLTNNGRAVIPAKLLTLLPSHTTFVLTFVLANRKETLILQPVSGKILAQAAFVYNTFIELR